MTERKRTRIKIRNEERILNAARTVFAQLGYRGATMDKIAELADMSQPNIHRYYAKKSDLYLTVLQETLDVWLSPLEKLDPDGDPAEQLRHYIHAKMEFARLDPISSRVFGHEMLDGAPVLKPYLEAELKIRVSRFLNAVDRWVSIGAMRPTNSVHLLLMIWATTQHYSDYKAQIVALLGVSRMTKAEYIDAESSIADIIVKGVCA